MTMPNIDVGFTGRGVVIPSKQNGNGNGAHAPAPTPEPFARIEPKQVEVSKARVEQLEREGKTPEQAQQIAVNEATNPDAALGQWANVPMELRALRQWTCWQYETRDGKQTKIPYQTNGTRAASNNPNTWNTFENCIKAATKFSGIGVMFAGELVGMDIDHCIENGAFSNDARHAVDTLQTYTEYSPSGTGLHLLCWGKLPEGWRKNTTRGIEMYGANSPKFFTVTGNPLAGTPPTVERRFDEFAMLHAEFAPRKEPQPQQQPKPQANAVAGDAFARAENPNTPTQTQNLNSALSDADVIRMATNGKNGEKFMRLWKGDTSDHNHDHSAADLALCSELAYWCGQNGHAQLDRIFRLSVLMRAKWDEQHGAQTYGEMTIEKAIRGKTEFYTPPSGQGAAGATNTTQSPQWLPLNDITDAFKLHEKGDAQLLAQLCAGRIAYDHAVKRWYFFGAADAPHSWERDRRAQIIHLVTDEIAAQYLHAAAELKRAGKATADEIKEYEQRAGKLQFKGRVDHVLDLAQSQKALALTGDEWDADAMLLACPNGVIDLRADAFAFRAGQPRDFVRTTAAAEWQGINTPAPRWEQFLVEIFAGNAEVISLMRRWFGYCLTGLTNEDAFVVLHGEGGRNGKRILTETIAHVMGEYAMIGDDDLLIQTHDKRAGAPKQYLLDIKGKRLVLFSETKKGARFNSVLVKRLSGSDRQTARGMFALEGTQIYPTWKIVLSTNPMPRGDSDDSAFFERLAVVEFSQQFVEKPDPQQPHQHKRDVNLKAKLDAEASGILAWLARGCLEWQLQGLNIPDQVRLTTREYRETQDELADYEQERLVRNPQAKARAGETYADYVKWVGQYADKKAMSSKVFGERMVKRFGKAHDMNGNYYVGVGLVI